MPTPADPELYAKAREIADAIYSKPSAYKSGFIVKTYKELGGTYFDDGEPRKLAQWFREDWQDVGPGPYPVYRPTRRVAADTPLTLPEIDPAQFRRQVARKQQIRGTKNLPAFKARATPAATPK